MASTATYDDANPFATPKDAVRTALGDTDTDHALVSDEIINALLGINSNIARVARECCDLIMAKLAREADLSGGKISQLRSQRILQYEGVARRLDKRLGRHPLPRWSNTTIAQHDKFDENDSNIQPAFRIGRDDNEALRDGIIVEAERFGKT